MLRFPSVPFMATFFAPDAWGDIIFNCVNFRLKIEKNAPYLTSCHRASNYYKSAWCSRRRNIKETKLWTFYTVKTDFHAARHCLVFLPRVPISVEFMLFVLEYATLAINLSLLQHSHLKLDTLDRKEHIFLRENQTHTYSPVISKSARSCHYYLAKSARSRHYYLSSDHTIHRGSRERCWKKWTLLMTFVFRQWIGKQFWPDIDPASMSMV